MNNSKDFLKKYNIVPFISFKETPKRNVKLMSDEISTLKGTDGNPVEGVKYVVEEEGSKKSFFTSSISLIQKLSEFNPGDEVTIEMKSRKGNDGKWKSYFVVTKPEESGEQMNDEDGTINEPV